jgi:hypothetical protein
MKKLVIAFAACALAGLASAQVYSQNVVGYMTRGFDGETGEFMSNIGVSLINMGTVDGSYVVEDKLFSRTCQGGDTVYVFDPFSWNLDSYSYNGVGLGWFFVAADGSTETIMSFSIPVGANLFFMPADGVSSVIIEGEVAPAGEAQIVFDSTDGDWMFPIANPFPIDTTLADIESFALPGDSVYVFDPINWNLDSYSYNGTGLGWFLVASDGSMETVMDTDTIIFPAGMGGFFMPADADGRTWTVTLNY